MFVWLTLVGRCPPAGGGGGVRHRRTKDATHERMRGRNKRGTAPVPNQAVQDSWHQAHFVIMRNGQLREQPRQKSERESKIFYRDTRLRPMSTSQAWTFSWD